MDPAVIHAHADDKLIVVPKSGRFARPPAARRRTLFASTEVRSIDRSCPPSLNGFFDLIA